MVFFGTDQPTYIPDPDNGWDDDGATVYPFFTWLLYGTSALAIFMIGSIIYSATPQTLFDKPCAEVWYYSDVVLNQWEFVSTKDYFNSEIENEIRDLPYVKSSFVPTYNAGKQMRVEMLTIGHRSETFNQIVEILNKHCRE